MNNNHPFRSSHSACRGEGKRPGCRAALQDASQDTQHLNWAELDKATFHSDLQPLKGYKRSDRIDKQDLNIPIPTFRCIFSRCLPRRGTAPPLLRLHRQVPPQTLALPHPGLLHDANISLEAEVRPTTHFTLFPADQTALQIPTLLSTVKNQPKVR